MTIETKELVISEGLKRKVEIICWFAYVDYEFINGNIKSIKNTNIAYNKNGNSLYKEVLEKVKEVYKNELCNI